MAANQKARWRKEIDWVLSVADHIVEFVPSQQVSEDGTNMEVRNESVLTSFTVLVLFNFIMKLNRNATFQFFYCHQFNPFSCRTDNGYSAASGSTNEHPRLAQA